MDTKTFPIRIDEKLLDQIALTVLQTRLYENKHDFVIKAIKNELLKHKN